MTEHCVKVLSLRAGGRLAKPVADGGIENPNIEVVVGRVRRVLAFARAVGVVKPLLLR